MREQRQRRKKKWWPKVVLCIALLFAIYLLTPFGNAGDDTLGINPSAAARNLSGIGTRDTSANAIEHPEGFPMFSVQMSVPEIEDTQYLKLVNRTHGIHTPVDPNRLVSAWPDIPVRATDILLHETAFYAMRALYQMAEQAGFHNLFIASGYRRGDEQSDLYENAVDRAYVMPSGHSEHQLGLAADILASGTYNTGGMAGTEEARFLAEHAPQFGLILRYPYHKQDITEVAYEPWHFRYVGRIHAWLMGQYDFVLEEYIVFLQNEGNYQVALDGREYTILYQRAENGIIFVPEAMEFHISSTNTGGYIVTAWR